MRILLNRFTKNKISNIKGQSYIEFAIMFSIIIAIFFTAFEGFWLISAQILVTNTAKGALRQVEIYGEYNNEIEQIIKESLSKIEKIKQDSIVVKINDSETIMNKKYQYRTPIKLKISSTYQMVILNDVYEATASNRFTNINLSATFSGISQRLHKDSSLPSPEFITEE